MISDYKTVQEFTLQTGSGSEGTLLLPRKILDTMVEEVDKELPPVRQLAAIYVGPGDLPGSSVDINRVVPGSGTVRQVGEGVEFDLSNAEYNTVNVRPDKYGVMVKITREMMEDSQFSLLQHNLKHFAMRFAENEVSLLISQSLSTGANTVSGGAAVTLTNIARARQYLRANDFKSTDMLVGPEVENDLHLIDTIVEVDKSGDSSLLRESRFGRLFGMNIWVVSQAASVGIAATTAYIIDRNQAYAFVEKRGMTVEQFPLPASDAQAVVISQRFRTVALRTSAIAIITST